MWFGRKKAMEDLGNDGHQLSPPQFHAGHNVITAARLASGD